MAFAPYYLKTAVVTAIAITDVQVITGTGAIEAPDLAATYKGGYIITPPTGSPFTVTGTQFNAYVALTAGNNQYVPAANVIQAAQVTADQLIVTGGGVINQPNSTALGQWVVQSTGALIDNTTFNNNYHTL